MANPLDLLELPERLEKQSKSSSGIMLLIIFLILGSGFVFIYISTKEIVIKHPFFLGSGVAMVFIACIMLYSLYQITAKDESQLRIQREYLTTTQMVMANLDLYIKFIEYNEKAIAYNEKNETPKMDILDHKDLLEITKGVFPN